jgi:hypothetical protein
VRSLVEEATREVVRRRQLAAANSLARPVAERQPHRGRRLAAESLPPRRPVLVVEKPGHRGRRRPAKAGDEVWDQWDRP